MSDDVLIIVPARSGSVRIPGKNFRPLAGRSPVLRTLDVARAACPTATIVVSTDAAAVDDLGPDITLHAQRDTGSMVDVVLDVLRAFPGPPEQAVLLLQPTQPLRTAAMIIRAAVDWLQAGHRSVATVTPTVSIDKLYCLTLAGGLSPIGRGLERDQDGRSCYRCDGTAYGFERAWFAEHRTFRHPTETRPVIIPEAETCPLDTPEDWYRAELILRDRERSSRDRLA